MAEAAERATAPPALADEGAFFTAGATAYYMRHKNERPEATDIDSWPAPVQVKSEQFRRMLCASVPGLRPGSKRLKDLLVEYEDLAWRGPMKPRVDWSSMVGSTLRVAVAPHLVVRVDKDGIHPERNGATAVYTLPPSFEPLTWQTLVATYDPQATLDIPRLRATLTGRIPPPIPGDPISTAEQEAVILAWWLGIFLESGCQGRPILGLFGGFQSGKTVTARLLGKAYYGAGFEVGGGVGGSRAEKDLVAAMNARPMTVRDDMQRESTAIADAICRLATGAAVELAVMHETLKHETFTARASLCVTAHTPVWAIRADLLSRTLPIRISPSRAENGPTERERQDYVTSNRAAIWMDTFCAIFGALSTPLRWKTSTRFEDWETWVRRAAHAGNWHGPLHAGLAKMSGQRVRLACDVDPFLHTLWQIARDGEEDPRWYTASDLYDLVAQRLGGAITIDPTNRPSARALSNPKALGRFLSQLEHEGEAVVSVERGPQKDGVATWRLRPMSM